jgi:hypothetical protein
MFPGFAKLFGNLANFAIVLATVKILSDLLGAWLGPDRQQQFRKLIEGWQRAVTSSSPDRMLTFPLLALSRIYGRLLGPQPFSRKAFRRTCLFGSLFLGASLGFSGLFSGKPLGMALLPWESFHLSVGYLRTLAAQASFQRQPYDVLFFKENVSDLARLGTWPFAACFTVYFAIVVVVATASLVSLSIAVSRLFLREMIFARSTFRIFILFLSSTFLLFIFSAGAALIIFVLLNIWTWPFVPYLFFVSKLSLAAGAGLTYTASMLAWFFSAPWLKIVIMLALSPSIILAIVIGINLIAFPFRRSFHAFAVRVLRTSLLSPRGPFSFISASCAFFAFLCASVGPLISWLAGLSVRLGLPTLFGADMFLLSLAVFVTMLILTYIRTVDNYGSSFSLHAFVETLFPFFAGLCVITSGFYLQAILECFVNPEFVQNGPLVLPALGALIPGSVVGYISVLSFLAGGKWYSATLRIFIVLTVVDLLMAVRGLVSYRDIFMSIVYNCLGAPAAAFCIFTSHGLMLRAKLRAAVRIPPDNLPPLTES